MEIHTHTHTLSLSLSLSHLGKCGLPDSAGANARRLMNAETSATNHAAASASARPDLARILICTGAQLSRVGAALERFGPLFALGAE